MFVGCGVEHSGNSGRIPVVSLATKVYSYNQFPGQRERCVPNDKVIGLALGGRTLLRQLEPNLFYVGSDAKKIKYVPQKPGASDCWSACLSTVILAEYGDKTSDPYAIKTLNSLSDVTDAGSPFDVYWSMLTSSKDVRLSSPASATQIISALSENHMLLAGRRQSGTNVGHVVLVVGATFSVGHSAGTGFVPFFHDFVVIDPAEGLIKPVDAVSFIEKLDFVASYDKKTNEFYPLGFLNQIFGSIEAASFCRKSSGL